MEAGGRRVSRFPLPIPSGWFVLGYSDELAPGQVEAIHYFGRDLVLFRTEAGEAAVFDAFCPHLGAHLGHGGRAVECHEDHRRQLGRDPGLHRGAREARLRR